MVREVFDSSPTFGYVLRDPATGIAVRLAMPSDAEFIAAIGRRRYEQSHGAVLRPEDWMPPELLSEEALRRLLVEASERWLIAIWSGEPIGFAELLAPPETGAKSRKPVAGKPVELRSILVAPDWSRNGAGSALVRASVLSAMDGGHGSLWTRIREGNDGALSFFEGRGFQQIGCEVAVIGHSNPAPVLILARPLDLPTQ